MLLLEDSGKTQKVTMRVDITQKGRGKYAAKEAFYVCGARGGGGDVVRNEKKEKKNELEKGQGTTG